VRAVRDIRQVIVWGRSAERGAAFRDAHAARTGLPVVFEADAERACASADIICCTTAATAPVLRGAWVRPGTHVNLVGSHDAKSAEADADLIARAIVFVDQTEAALREAGEIVQAIAAGAIAATQLRGELGRLIEGAVAGRGSPQDITVFKSVGLLAQDLVAGAYLVRQARLRGRGDPPGS
jgi:ornithine cyclodeaminase